MTERSRPDGGFQWTCPYCGKSQLNRSGGADGEANAIAALRSHVVASAGAGHGPVDEVPADADASTLSQHVDEVDGCPGLGE